MRRALLCTMTACTAMLLISCSQGGPAAHSPAMATDEDAKAMHAAGKLRGEALQAGDVEKYLSVYEDDAVIVPPHSAEIIGKASARSRLTEALKQVSIESAIDVREYQILGQDWMAERGRYSWNVSPKNEGEPFMDSGNFMLLWHKGKDGAWRISWEMWTSSRPIVEPAAK